MKLIAWRNWYCVLLHRQGFGLLDSVRFGVGLRAARLGRDQKGASDEMASGARGLQKGRRDNE